MYDRIVSQPGQNISLGASGGVLLLGPPGRAPGAMTLYDMQCRIYHLLREDGPDTGYPLPTTGDFPVNVVTRDLNIGVAEFLSQTGIAPGLVERQDTLPVYAGQDYPVPPGLQSLTQIEYNPYGGFSYYLNPLSLQEFVNVTRGIIPPQTGQPYNYREPFAGYVRLQPAPGQGQAVGSGAGTITITGTPQAGQIITATLVNPGAPAVTTSPYTVLNSDTANTVAIALSNAINASSAVSGAGAFLAPSSTTDNVVTVQALNPPGTSITIQATISGSGATVSPTIATDLSPTGDTMTWYYTSTGNLLVNAGDTLEMPPQFHMAPVYRVLSDYWERKQDAGQSDRYLKKFEAMVARGKAYTFDSNRASQPTTAGDDDDLPGWP